MRPFFILLVYLSCLPYSWAKPIKLENQKSRLIKSGFYFLRDSSGSINLQNAINLYKSGKFIPVTSQAWRKEVPIYWLKFTVQNTTAFDNEWIFDFENWSFVNFYYPTANGFQVKKTGHYYSYQKRDYPKANKNYIVVPLKAGESKDCFVRLHYTFNFDKVPQDLSFSVSDRTTIDAQEARTGKVIFAFLSIFAIMFLYNLFIYLSTRLNSYAYYLLVLIFAFYFTAGNSGYLISFFGGFDNFPFVFYKLEMIVSNLWGISYISFVKSFLNVKVRYPVWNKILNAILIGYVVFGVLIFVYFPVGFVLTALTGIVTIMCVIWLGLKSMRDRYPSAVYFLLGNTALLSGILCIILAYVGLLPKNNFTISYSLATGTTIEIILFSFALANLINMLRKENEEKQKTIIQQLQENQVLQNKVNQELEQKVRERTEELNQSLENLQQTQGQLVQKEKMASLGELTAGIAHEIQNPLNFVNNFAEVSAELVQELKKGPIELLPVSERDYADTIVTDLILNLEKITFHGKRADAIVKSMLQHTRSGTGQKEWINLNDLAQEYLRLAYHGVRVKDKSFITKFTTDFDPALGKVKAVPQDLTRVLLNLYNNAFYAIREKTKSAGDLYQPIIKVSTQVKQDKVELRIKDNGIGIPPEILNKIYQPFFTTKPAGQGTGLGLSLSFEIITQGHGGEVRVETEPGQFTEFIITLPYQKSKKEVTTT